jgi:hypothetical protein
LTDIIKYPYTYTSIVNGEKIHYGSFKIKHQKRLIELSENINMKEESEQSFFELLVLMCEDVIDFDFKKLYYVDFEYLLFMIRGKSYGEKISYSKTIQNKKYDFIFDVVKDLNVIGLKELEFQDIKLSNNEVIEISPVYLNEILNVLKIKNEKLLSYSILTYSLRKRKTDDEVFTFDSYEEKMKYLENLEINDLKELKNKYEKFPKLLTSKINKIKIGDYEENFKIEFMDILSNFFEVI